MLSGGPQTSAAVFRVCLHLEVETGFVMSSKMLDFTGKNDLSNVIL